MPTILSNNINLYYEIIGKGNPLVFIHGLGSSTRDWEHQVPAFSTDYQVITFDLRGHGRSEKPPGPYRISMFAKDLAGLLDMIGIGKINLIGISLGGCIAYQYTVDNPDRIKTLTAVNCLPNNHFSEKLRASLNARIGIIQESGMRKWGQMLSESLFPKPEQAHLRETIGDRWAENDPQSYIEALLAAMDWNVSDMLGSIRSPTLIIASDQDTFPLELKQSYARKMSDAEMVVISDAHHFLTLEKPNEFNAVLEEFLSKYN